MVEIDPETKSVIRIFSSSKKAYGFEPERVTELPRTEAIARIRKQVWERCAGKCEFCSKNIIEDGPLWLRMHLHELIPRGKYDTETQTFGEYSLTNSVGICQKCHEEDERGHANRKLRFGEVTNDNLN